MILHAVEAGTERGEGAPVVLLHGLFGAAANFAAIQRKLAGTHRVIAFDLRNHGGSPHDPVMPYADMAADGNRSHPPLRSGCQFRGDAGQR